MVEAVRALIGSPPMGYELFEYIVLAILLLLVVKIVIDVFFSIFRVIFKWS